MGCLIHSIDEYLIYSRNDTGPMIVQMVDPEGNEIPHFYYRSEQRISSSLLGINRFSQTYEGSIEDIPEDKMPWFKKYVPAPDIMDTAKQLQFAGFESYEEYLDSLL